MYDLERITRIIGDIERYFKDLENMKIKSAASLNKERFYSLSMILFAILNRVIDLGEEIVKAKQLGLPMSYKEIFQLLEKGGVINASLARELAGLASMRNVLAHEYYNVSNETVYNAYKRAGSIAEFVKIVKKLVNSGKNNKA
ncbi:MAG: DUF86 domain-containing protein [Nanoarchaeota archaeon]|nr:DUF86 domain-containing protein [Nanoarchaeota archaeon]